MGLFDVEPPQGLKPNLAGKFDEAKQKFPCFASAKIDGIRALGTYAGLLSRTLKAIPNRFVQARFADCVGLDGELVFGEPFAQSCMQATSSAVMSRAGTPNVKFYVFDRWDCGNDGYSTRLAHLTRAVRAGSNQHVIILEQRLINNQQELDKFEEECVAMGYEGVMVRSLDAKYKGGRSTTNEGGLLKLKRFSDAEAKVTGYTELIHQDGLVGDCLGALVCQTPEGVEFGIGTGFTADQRDALWAERNSLAGRIVRYTHFEASGVKTAPRFPVFFGFRDPLDCEL